MIDAIVFDLDGTLIDRQQAAERYWHSVQKRFPDIAGDELNALIELDTGEPDCAMHVRRYLTQCGPKQFLPELIRHVNETCTTRIADHLKENPAVNQMLIRLRSSYQLGVVTNGRSQSQRAKLIAADLDRLFSSIVISGEFGSAKPNLEIFKHAIEQVKVEPGRVLMVGDDPERDILGAAAAGMRTAWLNPSNAAFPGAPPDLQIRSILELEQAIQCLTPNP